MPDLFRTVLTNWGRIWSKMDAGQKAVVVSVAVALLVSLVFLSLWASQPDYVVLFSGLDANSAGKIASRLEDEKVPFKVTRGGSEILVPARYRDRMRLELASEGLNGGVLGYELLDGGSLGLTETQQKINLKRALEGELARTIRCIDSVELARVHIVMPEEHLFSSEERRARASVLLKLRPGASIDRGSVAAIQHLVAASVEDMRPEDVTVTDTEMRLLSRGFQDEEDLSALSAAQIETKQRFEEALTQRVQTLLTGMLGEGNAIVRVSAELDFQRKETQEERYDPEGVVISEESLKETLPPTTDNGQAGSRQESRSNYEYGKTVVRSVSGGGDVKRLSVAVVVNGTYKETEAADGTKTREFVPRTEEELKRIENLVRSAVGADASRGDEVVVESAQFEIQGEEFGAESLAGAARAATLLEYGRKVAAYLAAAVVFLVVRKRVRALTQAPAQVPAVAAPGALEVGSPQMAQRRIFELARRNPEAVARLLESWLAEE